jgi:hypothetical protein
MASGAFGGNSGGWNRSSRPMQSIGKTPVQKMISKLAKNMHGSLRQNRINA